MTRAPSASVCASVVGLGGAAAVITVRPCSSGCAASAFTSSERTIGAPFRWVTPSSSIRRHISSPRTARRHTWRPPAATIAHGWHQPLQWNIGSVQR